MRKILSTVLIIITACILSSCNDTKRITRQSFAFDTIVSITADKSSEETVENALSMCGDFENIFSRNNPSSELYRINNGEITSFSPDMQSVLDFSFRFSEISQGAFDITVAPLCDVWNVKERTSPPSKNEILEALSRTGYKKVTLSPFNIQDAEIDLGAVAKGYIADRLVNYFKENGAEDIIIDLGGNVALMGEFTVGIRNPFSPEKLFAKITVKDKSAVTSGAYQRYFEYDGKRYHHIIDPRTGQCADSGIASVTVVSPCSMYADALSTAIYVSGEKGLELCSNFPDTDAIIITNDGQVITTDGFKEKYNLQLK